MALSLADSLIVTQDLSQVTRQTLALVDGGLQWVSWATNSTLQRYSFPDETTLVGAVQQGLHGTSLAYLPRTQVFVSPVKLMTMRLDELKAISQWEAGESNSTSDSTIEGLLAAHDLIAFTSLAPTMSALNELGVGDSPLFASMGLIESLELQKWVKNINLKDDSTRNLAKEAAQFGIKQARQLYDFIDYYRTYIMLAEREPAGSFQSTDQRMTSSENILHALLPELFAYLDCPQTARLPSPDEVLAVVKEWLVSGKSLGFSRLSSGVRQIVATSSFRSDPATMAGSVRNYVLAANQFFTRQQEMTAIMKQDGSTCCYTAKEDQQYGELLLNPEHVISLYRFEDNTTTAIEELQS